jgi:two-component system response regulator FixJ
MTPDPTVFVVDDDEAVRESLSALLLAHGFRVETFASGGDFLKNLDPRGRGCVLIDVHMPGMDGLQLQARLAEIDDKLPVIVMTGFGQVPIAVKAMKAGAVDFIEKPFEEGPMLDAVRRALIGQENAIRAESRRAEQRARLARLTARERDVFQRLAEGKPNKIIAHELVISPRTVEIHRARVMEKLEAGSLSDLVRCAVACGVISETA